MGVWPAAYRGEAAAHVSVGHGEVGLVNGLLKDQVNDAFEPFLRVDGQVCHLLHQLVKLLRSQLVQDATDLSEELLGRIKEAVNDFVLLGLTAYIRRKLWLLQARFCL